MEKLWKLMMRFLNLRVSQNDNVIYRVAYTCWFGFKYKKLLTISWPNGLNRQAKVRNK